MAYRTHRFHWQGIEIEACYDPNKWNSTAHLEIESIDPPKARLPITETGYRSHFHTMGTIEAEYGGDVIAATTALLDTAAQPRACKEHEDAALQGDLFDVF